MKAFTTTALTVLASIGMAALPVRSQDTVESLRAELEAANTQLAEIQLEVEEMRLIINDHQEKEETYTQEIGLLQEQVDASQTELNECRARY